MLLRTPFHLYIEKEVKGRRRGVFTWSFFTIKGPTLERPDSQDLADKFKWEDKR